MKKIVLIYKSKTGFTLRYANWIKEDIDLELVDFSNIKSVDFSSCDLVIFGSRIFAGRVDGIEKIRKLNLGDKLIVFVTGATIRENESINEVWKNNDLLNVKHFYFPAGLNYEKMGLLDKMMMRMASKMISKKENKSEDDKKMENLLSKSYDICDKSNIKSLVEYVKKISGE